MRDPIPTFDHMTLLGDGAETGARASGGDFGAQVGDRMQELGGQIARTGGTLEQVGEMQQHMDAQQYVSSAMLTHRNSVDKYMADPVNYTDPRYSDNLSKVFDTSFQDIQKNAPNDLARRQLLGEFNDFRQGRMSSAFRTQTDVMMKKSYDELATAPNVLLDSYRTNLNSPNIDAGGELRKQVGDLYARVDRMYGQIAPQTARELKQEITSQSVYGVVNTNPDLARSLLDGGTVEGRTRHTLENLITSAEGAQTEGAKQEALDQTKGLLARAEMFPDQVQRGFPAEYFQAHGWKPKEAAEMSTKLQYQLDVNKDFATRRNEITGGNESSIAKSVGDMYTQLQAQSDPEKFNHDAQVFSRVQKFATESVEKLHTDPVNYLSNYNHEISSATQAYRDDPTPERFQNIAGLIKRYQGPAPAGDSADKYLNLGMHEMHMLDKSQAEQIGQKIAASGPKQAGEILHSTIQQYKPDDQGMVLNDLVNHGKIPIESYVMERTYGAPFSDKLNGAILTGKELRSTVGKIKGSTIDDLDKILDNNNTWLGWSKSTAGDNFQRQDVVSGFRGAIQTYALGMIQDGKTPADAIDSAVHDTTQWNHQTVDVNGRQMQATKNQYPGTDREFGMAIHAAINNLDINRINLANDNHTPIFPVAEMAGHPGIRDEAVRGIIQSKVFPNMNPDGKSFSLYVRGAANDFQLRDKSGSPITMQISDLPTFSYTDKAIPAYTGNPFGQHGSLLPYRALQTNWPSAPGAPLRNEYTFDGDTIKDSVGQTHRLLGIDAPEVAHDKYHRVGGFMGMESSNMVAQVTGGKSITAETHGKDKYGRSLSYISYRGTNGQDVDLNLQLIRMGLAQTGDVHDFSHPRQAQYEAAEAEAKAKKLGMWSRQ